jgi:hypothetical protein
MVIEALKELVEDFVESFHNLLSLPPVNANFSEGFIALPKLITTRKVASLSNTGLAN